ncbi:MAG: ArsA family ATPase, partial [Acidobacteria bacterium]|nr:ArsA family ATPase [Acidobacteriota bacterium]
MGGWGRTARPWPRSPAADVRHLLAKRALFFGGKGGVGKTTCSAATALSASRAGRRVLLVSTDPAHSLADAFGCGPGAGERDIAPRLRVLEIDAETETRRYLEQARSQLASVFGAGVLKEAMRQIELTATMPGVADVAMFDRMAEILLARDRDVDLV